MLTLPTEKYASSVKGAAVNKIGVKENMQASSRELSGHRIAMSS